jgi:beta-glucosidase
VTAVQRGLLPEAVVDQRVAALLRTMFRLGFFDPKEHVPFNAIRPAENDTPPHARLALQAARESIILLKNDGVLPLKKAALHHVAVIGPNATSVPVLLGNYNGTPSQPVTLLAGLKAALEPAVRVDYAHGCDYAAIDGRNRPIATGWWKGEYFANRELAGRPAAVRSDRPIVFDLGAKPTRRKLPAGIPDHDVSIRWTGDLLTTIGGNYHFVARGRGVFRLIVDGETIIDAWTATPEDNRVERKVECTRRLRDNATLPFTLEYVQGDGPVAIALEWSTPPADAGLAEALALARDADAIVYVGGITAQLEGEEMNVPYEGFAGGDRVSIELPAIQQQLLEGLHALGKPLVFLNLSGSAVAMPWAAEHVNAIVQSFYPGEAGGTAMADVLLGDYNPAGRLPVTFYRATADLPPFADYRMENRTYRYFTGAPLYPFGFGLSYTTFTYQHLRATPGPQNTVSVAMEVTNTGERDGDEVVQFYATPPAAAQPREREALCGFRRVHLTKGETKTISVVVPATALRRWNDEQKAYVIPRGDWTLRAAASSADIRQTVKVTL